MSAPITHAELHFVAVHLVLLWGHGSELTRCGRQHAEASNGSGAAACKDVSGFSCGMLIF
jgi:hypothetical protein